MNKDCIRLKFQKYINKNQCIERSIIFEPFEPISLFDDKVFFVWQTSYENEMVTIKLAKNSSVDNVEISGNFPYEFHNKEGSTKEQLHKELKRLLKALN